MPGLLKDSPSAECCRCKLPSSTGSSSSDASLDSLQEWLMARYRYLRQELEDVDREVSQLQRQMQQRTEQREARERLRREEEDQVGTGRTVAQLVQNPQPTNHRSLRDMLNRRISPVPERMTSTIAASRVQASAVYHPNTK